MRGSFRTLAAAGVALSLAALGGPAYGQENGFYVGGALGLGETNDANVTGGGFDQTVEFESGLAGIGALGYGFGNGLRTELELGYRENDIDSVSGVSGSGDVEATSAMANVAYDFNFGRITPYVGAGAGLVDLDFSSASPIAGSTLDDDDTVFGYQALAGVAFGVTDRIKLTLDYRFLNTEEAEFTTAGGTGVDTNYRNHSIMVGLRFSFGAPPAPPPAPEPAPVAQAEPAPPPPEPEPEPEPAPPVPRNFLVFFDFDRSNLTPEALEIVAAAADAATQTGTARIVATGHADRSGPAAYNVGLSQRRADAVRAELVRLGVNDSEIVTQALGETDPLVPTPDGVREPQNRRVEIVLQ